MRRTPLDALDETRHFNFRDVTLDLAVAEAKPLREVRLLGKGLSSCVPPKVSKLDQHGQLRGAEPKPPLRTQEK